MSRTAPIVTASVQTITKAAKVKRAYGHTRTAPFVMWDGEGYTDVYGEHHTMLWGCSTGEYIKGHSVSGFDCFDLMIDVAAKQKAIHVIYGGGYDVIMMIRNYPTIVSQAILQGKVRWWGGYRHEYFKGKFLKLTRAATKTQPKGSIILYDVFTFFSTSFVRACREYLGDNPDFDRIEATKLIRDSFTEESLEELVIPYWRQELAYGVELCTILRKRLQDAGIFNTQWHGPGAVASAVLKAKGIKAHMAETPDGVKEASRHAYYGGRFEQFQIGYIPGPVWQYDIRSAYPHAIRRLPSLADIKWVNRQKRKGLFDSFGLYRIDYRSHATVSLFDPAPFPWRMRSGNIYYPHEVHSSWYWGIEVQAAVKANIGTVTVLESWEPASQPMNYPFRWVEDMYDERAAMKKAGNPTQLALKLGMNSLYGKLAQSKGATQDREGNWKKPTYHQLEWAGWITAACRAQLLPAMVQAGSNIIAVETDAIYSHCQLFNLAPGMGEKLGEWEEEEAQAMLYVQSGVYFKKTHGNWKLKSRGFEPRNHTYEAWRTVMETLPLNRDATVEVRVRRFGTIPTSHRFAKWYELQRTSQILQRSSKRLHNEVECPYCLARDMKLSFVDVPHRLITPDYSLGASFTPSTPHGLPWVPRPDAKATGDDWEVSEEGMSVFIGLTTDTVTKVSTDIPHNIFNESIN